MIKKIGLGVLFAGLIGILIFGAVNRTIATTGDDKHSAGSRTVQTGGFEEGSGWGRQNNNSDTDSEGQFSRGSGQGGNGGGAGRNRASGSETLTNETFSDIEYIDLQGQVTLINDDLLQLTFDDGQVIDVEGRALRFIHENGFSLQVGDEIAAKGFYDAGDILEIASITNKTSNEELIIRDVSGRPMWAGRGGYY